MVMDEGEPIYHLIKSSRYHIAVRPGEMPASFLSKTTVCISVLWVPVRLCRSFMWVHTVCLKSPSLGAKPEFYGVSWPLRDARGGQSMHQGFRV